jgi:opacity protein-like surface antigen
MAARLRPYESIYSVRHAGVRVLRSKADIIGMAFRYSSRGLVFGAGKDERAALHDAGYAIFLEHCSSKSPNVLPTLGRERSLGSSREQSLLLHACKIWVNSKTETMMRKKWMITTFILFGMAALTGAAARGQAGAPAKEQTGNAPSERAAAVRHTQTDVGISGYKTFTSATSGNGTQQTPSDSAGGMLEVRHIVSPLIGYELTYSYNPANQTYAPKTGACGFACQNPVTKITGKASEIAIDYVASYKVGSLRPFVVGGLGFFMVFPGPTPFGNNTSVRPTYVYGGGLDWNIGARLGVRVQYRGNYYKAPNVASIYPATGVFTQTAEPMAGVFYRF